MSKVTIRIEARPTKNIYDLESQHCDRDISFGHVYQYAVVLPAYYNNVSYRCKSSDAALRVYKQLNRKGYQGVKVITRLGAVLDVDNNSLIRTDHPGYVTFKS